MNPNHENSTPKSAEDCALLDGINAAARAQNSGEIDLLAFRERVVPIEDETRILSFHRKLQRTYSGLSRPKRSFLPRSKVPVICDL